MEYVPATDEEEHLAASLVDEALAGYAGRIPPEALPEIRDYLIAELTITSYGRRELRILGARTAADRSAEVLKFGAVEEKLKKRAAARDAGAHARAAGAL
jgi:hypothetical protein